MSRVEVLNEAAGERIEIVDGEGDAVQIVGPNMGAAHRTMAIARLAPGSATVPLRHASEAVWYVVEGSGLAEPDGREALPLETGAMVHVAPGASYRLRANADEAMRILGGPSPPDADFATGGLSAEPVSGDRDGGGEGVRLFHRDRPSKRVPMISSDARLVVWIGVGAKTANMNYVRLVPGEENQPHSHAESEDTIMILSGRGSVDDLTNGVTLEFEAGDVIHVPIGLKHRVKADRGSGVESVGGPCPPDMAMAKAADPA
jgi:quercetin dioxygenase-like cupin family protein